MKAFQIKGLKTGRCILKPPSVLLFHQASMQLFTEFNKLLQRSEPTIHVLRGAMLRLVKKVSSRIVQPHLLKVQNLNSLTCLTIQFSSQISQYSLVV